LSIDLSRLIDEVGAAVVRKELQGASLGNALDVNKAPLYRLDEHLAYWLARQAFTLPSPVFLVVFAVLLLS
jgi:hypothetical protein